MTVFQCVTVVNERGHKTNVDIRDIHKYCANLWRHKKAKVRDALLDEVRKAIATTKESFSTCGITFWVS